MRSGTGIRKTYRQRTTPPVLLRRSPATSAVSFLAGPAFHVGQEVALPSQIGRHVEGSSWATTARRRSSHRPEGLLRGHDRGADDETRTRDSHLGKRPTRRMRRLSKTSAGPIASRAAPAESCDLHRVGRMLASPMIKWTGSGRGRGVDLVVAAALLQAGHLVGLVDVDGRRAYKCRPAWRATAAASAICRWVPIQRTPSQSIESRLQPKVGLRQRCPAQDGMRGVILSWTWPLGSEPRYRRSDTDDTFLANNQ